MAEPMENDDALETLLGELLDLAARKSRRFSYAQKWELNLRLAHLFYGRAVECYAPICHELDSLLGPGEGI